MRAGVAALLLAVASAAHAAPSDPSAFTDLNWRSIGPFRGGRVLAAAGAPDDRLRFYLGAVNGGVWETRDAGRTWSPIADALPVASIGALAIAPSAPRTIYVGTGEADMRSDIAQGQGLFRSADGGKTWAAIGLADSRQIARILVDPRDPDVVLVAALGHPYGPSAERGVFRTTDGGKTWAKTLFKDADTGAIDLTFKPGDPSTVYAALWQTRRPPWNTYPPSSGPGGGLYRSTDGGVTWAPLTGRGLPGEPGRIGLAVAPSAPGRLYVLIDAKAGGLWRSDDDGATFAKVSGDPRIWERGWYFGELTVNPANADQLWVCDTIVLRSDDGGKSFVAEKGDPSGDDFHHLWIDPADPARRMLATDQGALVTLNGGATWSSWFNQPTGQFYHVATDNRFPYRVYGAQQDSGAAGVASRTGSYDGVDISQFHEVAAGGESDNIAPDPDDPDTVYGGRVDRLDLRTGQMRNIDPTLAFPDAYRATWTLPLVFSPRDHALYFANQRVFRTTDGGQRWRPISPDLTRPEPGVPANLDPVTAKDDAGVGPRKGVVYSLGPSPRDAADLWAGTDDGLVWRTRDGGGHWNDVTPKGLAAWSKVGAIEPSHFDRETAYIAIDRHRLDDQAPYVWRTRDGGRSWTPIGAGLAAGGLFNAVNVVREDPVRRGLLYAGTERGAFVSLDDGGHWTPLGAGLPVTSVRDITVHGADLVIATHGRGFWILDDIAALRELAAGGAGQGGARLYAPSPATRMRPDGFTGTPKPKDEPMAPNPPDGAYLDYWLARAPKTPLVVAILDGTGAEVASFRSDAPHPAPDPGKTPAAPEWLVTPAPPSAAPGPHRFVWDLHFPKPAWSQNPFETGVWAPPGRYQVALTVDGKTLRQPLELKPDPRVTAPPEAYARAFALARRIDAERGRLHDAMAAGKPGVDAKALSALAARLAKLAAAADSADGGPTPDVETGWAEASEAVDAALKAPPT